MKCDLWFEFSGWPAMERAVSHVVNILDFRWLYNAYELVCQCVCVYVHLCVCVCFGPLCEWCMTSMWRAVMAGCFCVYGPRWFTHVIITVHVIII